MLDRERFPCSYTEWQEKRPATSYYDTFRILENGLFERFRTECVRSVLDALDEYAETAVSPIAGDTNACLELVSAVSRLNIEWTVRYGKENSVAKRYLNLHQFLHRYISKYSDSKTTHSEFFPPKMFWRYDR